MSTLSNPGTLRNRRVRTWSSFGNLGRKPNEYEVVTHNMNHTIGAVPLEMSADVHGNRWLIKHRDGIALKVSTLDSFRDPDQMTYRKYTQSMDQQETYVDGLLQQYTGENTSDLGLNTQALNFLSIAMTPARYLGHGLQMVSAYMQQLAHSSYLANCAAFQTADQLRRVQRVSYRTRQLANAHPDAGFGAAERSTWENHAGWQPTREAIEKLMVAYDWDQTFVGLNLVVKPLADQLFLHSFAAIARAQGNELDALIAENLWLDAQRSRRWTIDACKAMHLADGTNQAVLQDRLAQWAPLGQKMIHSASLMLAGDAGPAQAAAIANAVKSAWTQYLSEAGLSLPS
jgi:toluene monooxygenase system protein E